MLIISKAHSDIYDVYTSCILQYTTYRAPLCLCCVNRALQVVYYITLHIEPHYVYVVLIELYKLYTTLHYV